MKFSLTKGIRTSVGLLTAICFCGCFRLVVRDVEVSVPDMKGPDCGAIVQEALSALDGVEAATPDFERGIITVRYDSEKLAVRNIHYVIAAAGFAADNIPPHPAAQAKLPGGCK